MPQVPPANHGFGLFGPDFGVPLGGFCLSTFLLLEDEDHTLAGRMHPDHAETWIEEWAPNLAYYEDHRYEALFEGPRFPATYLREGEHPSDAAARIWQDQLGLPDPPSFGEPEIFSEIGDSRRAPEAKHWDLFFVYTHPPADLPDPIPEHWSDLSYRPFRALREEGMVLLHDELFDLR